MAAVVPLPPETPRRLSQLPAEDWSDPPGLLHGGSIEDAEHRRLLTRSEQEIAGIVLTTRRTASFCTADTTVSSSSFISVTGMAQSRLVEFHGVFDLTGALYVEETVPGQLSVRIVDGTTVLWTVTVGFQGSTLDEDPQLATWVMPIGGPDLLDVDAQTVYSLDVEIAAPSGTYKVLAGAGKESNLNALLYPDLGI